MGQRVGRRHLSCAPGVKACQCRGDLTCQGDVSRIPALRAAQWGHSPSQGALCHLCHALSPLYCPPSQTALFWEHPETTWKCCELESRSWITPKPGGAQEPCHWGKPGHSPAFISLNFCLRASGVRRYWSSPSFHLIFSRTCRSPPTSQSPLSITIWELHTPSVQRGQHTPPSLF